MRGPFEVEDIETPSSSTMRMPPFMRQSNAQPLTLSSWQYQLLIEWVTAMDAAQTIPEARAPLSSPADERRAAVLARLAGASGQNP